MSLGIYRYEMKAHGPRSSSGLWPTPTARDYRPRPNSPDLEKVAGGLLNPTWVEWLMGFPREWTEWDELWRRMT
jgi:hypothetical protein